MLPTALETAKLPIPFIDACTDTKRYGIEVENIDELVRAGYYGCRSDAIRDVIRRGAASVRARYPSHFEYGVGEGAKEEAKRNLAPALTAGVQTYINLSFKKKALPKKRYSLCTKEYLLCMK